MKTSLDSHTLLQQLAQLLLDATRTAESDSLSRNLALESLPTAIDIAKQLRLDADLVKKKLKILKQEGLVQATSFSPKRYRFDRYHLAHLDEESVLYPLFCGESPSHALDFGPE
ncbi:MAG: hypothetical protein VKJ04_07440 [Vampirovibrionales bacterium]|nr:hypothetical protein [Vampirovibrionales bacterium]